MEIISFLIASRMGLLLNLFAMSRRALIETYLILGTGDDRTLKILPTHLSTYLSPMWLRATYLRE